MSEAGKQVRGRPFQKGNPGRPKGSRNKLRSSFFDAIHEDFELNGRAAIIHLRETDPVAYLQIIASLIPKQVSDEDDEVLTPPVLVIQAWEPEEAAD